MIEKISNIFHLCLSEMVNWSKFILKNKNNNKTAKRNSIKLNKKMIKSNFNTYFFEIITFPIRNCFEFMYYIYITVPLEFISRCYIYVLAIIQSVIKSIFLVFNKRSTNNLNNKDINNNVIYN
jgi:hypothetical protein